MLYNGSQNLELKGLAASLTLLIDYRPPPIFLRHQRFRGGGAYAPETRSWGDGHPTVCTEPEGG